MMPGMTPEQMAKFSNWASVSIVKHKRGFSVEFIPQVPDDQLPAAEAAISQMVDAMVTPMTPTPQGRPPRIVIGIPYEVKTTMLWAMKMLGPLLYVPLGWCEKVPKMSQGRPLPVRDRIVEMALADPLATHILWVDTDNICVSPPDPNAAMEMLYKCDKPIVSGLYRSKKQDFSYAAYMDAHLPDGKVSFIPIQSDTGGLLQVDGIGFGFCLTKREVFEKIPKPWFPWNTDAGEDFNFCIAARKQGYDINVLADVKLGHIGDLMVNPDGMVTVLAG